MMNTMKNLEIRPLLKMLYQESFDSFSLFDGDYKHLAFMLSYYNDSDRGFYKLLNNYALYLSKNGEKEKIKENLEQMEKIVLKNEPIVTKDVINFNELRDRLNKHLENLEKSLKNALILFSELYEALPQKSRNSCMHYRKSSDDEMEILRTIKVQYIESSLKYFANWFDFSGSEKFKDMELKHVFDSIFRSTMVYIDYSTETKFKRNTEFGCLESIMLPYSSMMMPKNFSIISHEINYYVFQHLKPYLSKKKKIVIDSFYENVDQLITKLGIIDKSPGRRIDNFTEVLVDKFLVDYITLFTAGPNYLMSLFCLLSKRFLNSKIRLTNAPEFARILFLNEIIDDLLIDKYDDQDKDCYKDYAEMRKQIGIYTDCSMMHMPTIDKGLHQQFTDINNFFSKKMLKLIRDESAILNDSEGSVNYTWKAQDKFYSKEHKNSENVQFKEIYSKIINLEEPTSLIFTDYSYQYKPDLKQKAESSEDKKTKNDDGMISKLREYGAIMVPEILWEIENRVWLSEDDKSICLSNDIKPKALYHFPQLRISRIMSCGLRIAILRSFFNLYAYRDSEKNTNYGFMPIDRPKGWFFFDINWRKMFKSFHSFTKCNVDQSKNDQKELVESCLLGLKKMFSANIEEILGKEKDFYYHGKHTTSNIDSQINGLHYSLCENGYFIPLNNTITRCYLEKWPIWVNKEAKEAKADKADKDVEETFNDFVESQFTGTKESSSCFVQNFYSYTNVVAEKICSSGKPDIKESYKYLILGKLKNKSLQLGSYSSTKMKETTSKNRRNVFSDKEVNVLNEKVKKDINKKILELRYRLKDLIEKVKITKYTNAVLKNDIESELARIKNLFKLDNIVNTFKEEIKKDIVNPEPVDGNYEIIFKKILNKLNLLRMELLNSGIEEYFCIYNIVIELHNSLKELNDFLTVISLIELIKLLDSKKQLFDIYLTNSWSDFGLILYQDPSNHGNGSKDDVIFDIVRELQCSTFSFSRTYLLMPDIANNSSKESFSKEKNVKHESKENENKLWNVNLLIETTRNYPGEIEFDEEDFHRINIKIKASLGQFDFHISYSCDSIEKIHDIAGKVLKKVFKKIANSEYDFAENGDIGIRSISTSIDFSDLKKK